ncbi:MAG: molybdopterin-dependent oxidoreductase [Campylobacterota bacterium]|nr:molybdopterin-dependent oxidoreductase [Campylobacterota bacterium]
MINSTACPLDCYDACAITYGNGKLAGSKRHELTQGYLCPHLNHYDKFNQIQVPTYKGEPISMQKAVEILIASIKKYNGSKILHYRGHGNFALMQGVTDYFFSKVGATLTSGSLCDGAGEAGIIEGRGSNKTLDLEQINKSEVVIVWGRNLHVTNSHLLPYLKDKKIIVIDPVRTKMAECADLFIQLKPHGDMLLALLLSRFAVINELDDEEFLKKHTDEFEEFYELTQTIRIKSNLDLIDVDIGDVAKLMDLIEDKKVVILAGVGVQKNRDGASTLRAIDAFAATLGLFAKEGCGVSYLGSSQEGISNPFDLKSKRVPKATADFSKFNMIFVQGANPLNQMPSSLKVKQNMSKVELCVYYGLYENETLLAADLVIPACNFLQKSDIRCSYGSNHMLKMPQVQERSSGISEYELTLALSEEFQIELESEEDYLKHFKSFLDAKECGSRVKGRDELAYENGFDTDNELFLFMDEFEFSYNNDDKLFLITCKSPRSLNSQFQRDNEIHVNPALGFRDGEEVEVSSDIGSVNLHVKNDDSLREDTVLIYSGVHGVNNLTPSYLSYEGENAVFQDKKVEIKRCK